jgi:hypothetical protein
MKMNIKIVTRDTIHAGLCLSVAWKNPATRLYLRYGFRDAGVSGPQDSSVTLLHLF